MGEKETATGIGDEAAKKAAPIRGEQKDEVAEQPGGGAEAARATNLNSSRSN